MALSKTPSIRLFTPDQATEFRAIRLKALQSAPDAFGSTYQDEVSRPLQSFEERIRNTSIFSAYVDDTAVAMAGFGRHQGPKERHKGFVWGVFVAPEIRGQGIGSLMIDSVVHHASSIVEQLTLTVVSTHVAAVALYKSRGFEPYGVEPRALKTQNDYADETLMVRFFDKTARSGSRACLDQIGAM